MNQLELLQVPPQPRRRTRERDILYAAILALRRDGHTVRRSGRSTHSVNGRRYDDTWIIATAALLAPTKLPPA